MVVGIEVAPLNQGDAHGAEIVTGRVGVLDQYPLFRGGTDTLGAH